MESVIPSCDASMPVACTLSEALLAEDDATAEQRWHTLDDAGLNREIELHRRSLRTLAAQLDSLSSAHPHSVGPSPAEPATEGGEPDAVGIGGAAEDRIAPVELGGDERQDGADCQVGSLDDADPTEWQVPPHCIPIHANVTTFDWTALAASTQFDVVMMDPPWALATANPTRGVALGYSQLTDADIVSLPLPQLQSNGFLFIWVINAKYKFTLDLFEKWGYQVVDEVVWVKMTVHRRLAKSHGYYLQHAKEVCLVGRKGTDPTSTCHSVASDVIYSERRGQSQKPEEIYQIIEELVPNGKYLEIFGRKNNLRDYWVTVGNEVTGTGLPDDDQQALHNKKSIPGAVYGARNRTN